MKGVRAAALGTKDLDATNQACRSPATPPHVAKAWQDPLAWAEALRKAVRLQTCPGRRARRSPHPWTLNCLEHSGCTCSVGIGPSQLVAKLATKVAIWADMAFREIEGVPRHAGLQAKRTAEGNAEGGRVMECL